MRVAVILTARPSWAKLETVVEALLARGVDVHILACASALLERYGRVVDVVRARFPAVPITEVWSTYEGANLITSAKETGALLCELAAVVSRLSPATVVVCADRHEVLAAAQAAAYLHVPLCHLQGGERTGSIDDRVRDSITHLSQWHCVATERAKFRVYGLTGSDQVYRTGCPSLDLAMRAVDDPPVTAEELGGAGGRLDPKRPFVLVLQHPVTNEAEDAFAQMTTTLDGVSRVDLPRVVLWPGEDAGMEATSKAIRVWVAEHPAETWHTLRNLPPARFLRLLRQAACLVGNSSAGIRECSALGVPVVNIGTRQWGRERAWNVVDVPHAVDAIEAGIRQQVAHGPYRASRLYGAGDAGARIAEVICRLPALNVTEPTRATTTRSTAPSS